MGRFERDGYTVSDLVLRASACEIVADELPRIDAGRGGVRDLLGSAVVRRIIGAPQFVKAVSEFVDLPLVAVKATLFDKTPQSNWRVQWHQDRIIAVRERRDADGYGAWSTKNGVTHVEPPVHVLESMVAVRVQLDDCGADNGPLRVIPGSHRRGKLTADELAALVAESTQGALTLPRGSFLLMRPLLVHASSPATTPGHRRVLHIELAREESISPLQWHEAVPLTPR